MKRIATGILLGLSIVLTGCTASTMSDSMHDMTSGLQNKVGNAFDEAFLSLMITHHQGAIVMAEQALKVSAHDEIKAMATNIISAQQKEIDEMKAWQKTWGYVK